MGLTNVWVQTLGDGLVRADQVIGIDNHPTPAVAGKPSRWLLVVVLPVAAGSGLADRWDITALHRTVIQTPAEPVDAPQTLARLLAQIADRDVAGIISARNVAAGEVEFDFAPFPALDHVAGAPSR